MGFIIFPSPVMVCCPTIDEDRRTIDVIILYSFGDDDVFIGEKVKQSTSIHYLMILCAPLIDNILVMKGFPRRWWVCSNHSNQFMGGITEIKKIFIGLIRLHWEIDENEMSWNPFSFLLLKSIKMNNQTSFKKGKKGKWSSLHQRCHIYFVKWLFYFPILK